MKKVLFGQFHKGDPFQLSPATMTIDFLEVGETLLFRSDACMSVITIRLNDGSDKPRSHYRAISGKKCSLASGGSAVRWNLPGRWTILQATRNRKELFLSRRC